MENPDLLSKYGLFRAKVPRYTSYPPANRFEPDVGHDQLPGWLDAIRNTDKVSVYAHIPFCSRLCWFCACRTQGTKTLRPVETYVQTLLTEIDLLRARLPQGVSMSRLHLGGGTPTLLSPALMDMLLHRIFEALPTAGDFEFSVEIDPTEAAEPLLDRLVEWGMQRASIGVQDFDPQVQAAIGRAQSFEQTRSVTDYLRDKGVRSVNLDLLYGLPHQTKQTLGRTMMQVMSLAPDRLALYGYAHVPQMSKRQVMIPQDLLPGAKARFDLAQMAQDRLVAQGYQALGIDHFARPQDSLAIASEQRRMRRNFQGYTDDPCATLLGLGASAISRFPQGYAQNAVATAAWSERVTMGHLPANRGFAITPNDKLVGDLIQSLMCYGDVRLADVAKSAADQAATMRILTKLRDDFADAVCFDGQTFAVLPQAHSLIRVLAAEMDEHRDQQAGHSLAV